MGSGHNDIRAHGARSLLLTNQTDSNRTQARITLSTRCGVARHEVVYAVSPWGHTYQAYTPCQSLPGRLLRSISGNCETLVPSIRTALQWTALPESDLCTNWLTEGVDPRGDLRSYLTQLASDQSRIATQILGSTSEERVLSALKLGTTSEKWAAAVTARLLLDSISTRVLSLLRSNCSSTQPVTKAIALVCVVRNSSKESRCCVGEYLLDESVALPIRDHLALNLAKAPANTPLSQLFCEVTESSGCKRAESWDQLRTRGGIFTGDKITNIVRKI